MDVFKNTDKIYSIVAYYLSFAFVYHKFNAFEKSAIVSDRKFASQGV